AEDGIRDFHVTGVQTCALPILDLAVGTGASVSTSSFTPPEGGLLVALVAALTEDTPEVSGGSLSWTRRRQQVQFGTDYAEIWTRSEERRVGKECSCLGSTEARE